MDGAKILRETYDGNTLVPLYDNEDSVCGIIYNTVPYYFQKNLQGDIIAITDQNGNTIARYSYDAWGACTIVQDASGCGIATINPFRYRGYYYDAEIGVYYLQSRYYNPGVGRFISVDDVIAIGVLQKKFHNANLFLYCSNNPIMYSDHSGMLPLWAKITIGIVGIAAAIALTVASGGSLFPAILTALKFVAGSMAISMAIGGLVGYLQNGMSGLKQGLLNGAVDGFMWGGISAALSAAVAFIKVMKTVKTIRNFTVSKKHLSYAGGKWSKFNTANQNTIRDRIRKAVQKRKPIPNGNKKDSFIIVYKIGKVIGKNGERCIKVVYDKAGNIWTAFPAK